jgi:glycosyltransferase involved in cell wall biosynthesis
MRLGLLYPGAEPLDPRQWSGTPAGLAAGFAAVGVEVVPIGSRLPWGARKVVALASRATGKKGAVADRQPVKQLARTLALKRCLDRVGQVDAVLAMGTEMYDLAAVLPSGMFSATYDDGTLAQMWGHGNSDLRLSGFPEADVALWIDRQSQSTAAADVNFVSTGWAQTSFLNDYGMDEAKVHVVGMGHNPRTFCRKERDWTHPTYLFVGVDWRRKNGERVLAAFREVRDRYPQATLHLVGEVPPTRQEGVTVHGFLAREDAAAQAVLVELYSKATCFVLPSLFDPSPIACLEAASAGVPVIATTEGGAGELLGNGAAVVSPTDLGAIADAMLRFADPDEARRCGAAAAKAANNSTWARVAERISAALVDRIASTRINSTGGTHV